MVAASQPAFAPAPREEDLLAGHILVEGRNCWRRERASRVAFLIDGAAYFAAFAAAVERARRSILILGWDFHSRIRLRRDGRSRPVPEEPGALLDALVARLPGLHANVLSWNYAIIYALERQRFQAVQLGWRTHRGFHFRLDGTHPLGASHHQKIVVIDDAVAFVGGLDLAACRWDTSAHHADDPRRIDPGFGSYLPFHDVQVAVSGPVAAALGELARERWRRATGQRLPRPDAGSDPWPPELAADLDDVPVAVARTEPRWDGRPGVREIEALWLDTIRSAERSLYIETQYLSAEPIEAALAARLGERRGPEVVLVTPLRCSGWLEQMTMGVLRDRLLERLRGADRFGRLRVYHPVVPALSGGHVNVHAKLLVADDQVVRIGSSNLTNRSMGLDTECDVAIEAAGDARVAHAVGGLRERLLGEHLGVPAEAVAHAVARTGSLIGGIETLRGGSRTLEPVGPTGAEWLDHVVPDAEVLDPGCPERFETLYRQILLGDVTAPLRRRVAGGCTIAAALAALGAIYSWTPVAEAIERLVDGCESLWMNPLGALALVAAFVIAALLTVPSTALVVGATLLLGAARGFAYALAGLLVSATLAYALGRVLPGRAVGAVAGSRLPALRRRLENRGALALAALRLFPAAPFTVVNVVAGSTRLRPHVFAAGTVIPLVPGTALAAALAGSLSWVIEEPAVGTVLIVVGILFLPLAMRWASAASPSGTSGV